RPRRRRLPRRGKSHRLCAHGHPAASRARPETDRQDAPCGYPESAHESAWRYRPGATIGSTALASASPSLAFGGFCGLELRRRRKFVWSNIHQAQRTGCDLATYRCSDEATVVTALTGFIDHDHHRDAWIGYRRHTREKRPIGVFGVATGSRNFFRGTAFTANVIARNLGTRTTAAFLLDHRLEHFQYLVGNVLVDNLNPCLRLIQTQ